MRVTRRAARPLSVAAVGLFAAFAATARPAVAAPNVVYFLVDDLGYVDCGFAGGTEIRTPAIDKLAAEGCVLKAFYAQPVCSPTRAALLTGRYPMRHGLQVGVVRPWATYGLPLDEKTIADDLRAAGYATGVFGKWHLGHCTPEHLPTARGFARQYGHYNGALDYFAHTRDGGLDWHVDDKPLREEGYTTTLIGEHAAAFVRETAGKQPFLLYVPFNGVHSPYQAPTGGIDAYPNLSGQRRNYAAMLSEVDAAIGKVVAAVEQAGVRGNTLFIFSSDNGGPAPRQITDNGILRAGKGTLYEGGVRVAAFATWDGHIVAGSACDEPLHVVDWRPTLQKLCGAPASSVLEGGNLPMDGRDAWPTLTTGSPSPHDAILLNTTPQNGAVRVGDWKLIARRGARPRRTGRAVELFNLRDDPSEQTNLAASHPEKVDELQAILDEFAAEAIPPKGSQTPPPDYAAPAVWGEFESRAEAPK